MTDEFEQAGIAAALKRFREELLVPTRDEVAKLEQVRKRLRDVRMIRAEDEEFAAYMFEKYPEWCRKLSEQEQQQARG